MPEIMRLAFKYKLRPTGKQEQAMRNFSGCCRFAYNALLAQEKEEYQEYLEELESRLCWGEALSKDEAKALCVKPKLNQYTFNYALKKLKEEYPFLKEYCHSQVLQQKVMDLYEAFKKFFKGTGGYPKFKKRHSDDGFRYPQGFKVEEDNGRIFLPKIGYVRYRNSRKIEGIPKNVTVREEADGWYVSIQCEFELKPEISIPDIDTAVGIDMGVKRFLTLSDGNFINNLEEKLKPLENKIALLQKRIKHKVKGSNNIKKAYLKLTLLHKRKADIRNDFLHQVSTLLVKNHDVIVIEDLKVRNMSKSAKGSIANPGTKVKAKSGLNRSILNEAWHKFFTYLEYKLKLKGGILIKVNPKHTSQTCIKCGHISKDNRKEQEIFKCVKCGYEAHADHNAAQNILRRAGLARMACQANLTRGRQQEPA